MFLFRSKRFGTPVTSASKLQRFGAEWQIWGRFRSGGQGGLRDSRLNGITEARQTPMLWISHMRALLPAVMLLCLLTASKSWAQSPINVSTFIELCLQNAGEIGTITDIVAADPQWSPHTPLSNFVSSKVWLKEIDPSPLILGIHRGMDDRFGVEISGCAVTGEGRQEDADKAISGVGGRLISEVRGTLERCFQVDIDHNQVEAWTFQEGPMIVLQAIDVPDTPKGLCF